MVMKSAARKNASALVAGMLVLGFFTMNILFSIRTVAFHLDFYVAQWDLHDIPFKAQISASDLKLVGMKLIDYFRGKRATPQIEVAVDGHLRPLYRQNELIHLDDVRILFRASSSLMWAAVITVLLALVLAAWLDANELGNSSKLTRTDFTRRVGLWLSKSLKVSGVLLVVVTLVLAVPAAFDFTGWWTGFHVLTFQNELWRLDPNEDWLIKIFPEEFFLASAKRVAIHSAALTAFYIMIGTKLCQDLK